MAIRTPIRLRFAICCVIGIAILIACLRTSVIPVSIVERDLRLILSPPPDDTVTVGTNVFLPMRIVNQSNSRSYGVVHPVPMPNEPITSWIGTIENEKGEKKPLTEFEFVRCGGSICSGWDASLRLGPQESLTYTLARNFAFREPGRVRLKSRYEYRGRRIQNWDGSDAGHMAFLSGMPPFTLESNEIEFTVVKK